MQTKADTKHTQQQQDEQRKTKQVVVSKRTYHVGKRLYHPSARMSLLAAVRVSAVLLVRVTCLLFCEVMREILIFLRPTALAHSMHTHSESPPHVANQHGSQHREHTQHTRSSRPRNGECDPQNDRRNGGTGGERTFE